MPLTTTTFRNPVDKGDPGGEGSLFVSDDEYDKNDYSSGEESTLIDIIRNAPKRSRSDQVSASSQSELSSPFHTAINFQPRAAPGQAVQPAVTLPPFASLLHQPYSDSGPPEHMEPPFTPFSRQGTPIGQVGSLAGYQTERVSLPISSFYRFVPSPSFSYKRTAALDGCPC